MKSIVYTVLAVLTVFSCNVHKEQRIMTYNIRNAIGMDDITDYGRIAAVITSNNADVVAVQEIDSAAQRSNGVFVLEEIARHAKMELSFGASIPFQGGKYGIGILSKEKPLSTKSFALPGREEKRSALVAEFEDYVVCCTHFSLNPEDRLASVAIINDCTKAYKKPVFLAGDLNDSPSSNLIRELQKSWTILNDTDQPTIPSDNPKTCIDYVLVRKTDKVEVINTAVIDEKIASDHLPVYVDVTLPTFCP
ncbi:MAG: endonuclease/exonuclease/phosphatase family protein [Prevotellaceae bacterium]|jgi:endonuclease/exonuclease/phosphatase family metal-dependent hydrolase|nr:endonuclease/exonuclease/phosphatase family protein [Prevotellaceae bacterium]